MKLNMTRFTNRNNTKPMFRFIFLLFFVIGCQADRHRGHIYIHDDNHVEVQFDRPMTMSVERDGVKVEASSMKPGFFEDLLKFILLRPRN